MAQSIGHGSKFQVGSGGSSETFTDTAGVTGIDFGSNKIDSVQNTDMGSPGNQHTFIPGMENPGDLSVKLNVIPGDASQLALFGFKGVVKDFKVIYPGAVASRTFQGFITSIDESIPDDKLPTYTAKVQITGPVTRT